MLLLLPRSRISIRHLSPYLPSSIAIRRGGYTEIYIYTASTASHLSNLTNNFITCFPTNNVIGDICLSKTSDSNGHLKNMQPRSRQASTEHCSSHAINLSQTSFGSNSGQSGKSSPGTPIQYNAPPPTRQSGGRLSGLLKPLTPISGQQAKGMYNPPPGAPPSRRGSVNTTQHPAGASRLATSPSAIYTAAESPATTSPRPRSYTSNPYVNGMIQPASPRTSVGQMTPAGERVRRRSTVNPDSKERKGSMAQAQGLEPLKPRKSFFGAVEGLEEDDKPQEDVLNDAIKTFSLAWEDLFGTTDVENTLINQILGGVKGLKGALSEVTGEYFS